MQTADTSFNFLIYNVLLSIGIACFFDSLLERNYKILSLPACIMICSVAALITETILIHQVVMRLHMLVGISLNISFIKDQQNKMFSTFWQSAVC